VLNILLASAKNLAKNLFEGCKSVIRENANKSSPKAFSVFDPATQQKQGAAVECMLLSGPS
jgi:hypothetical protein